MIVSEMTNECARNYTICCNRFIDKIGQDFFNKDNASEEVLAAGNQTSNLLITHIRAVSHSSERD